jgi:hypothetical protein
LPYKNILEKDRPENFIMHKQENKFINQNKTKNDLKIRIENEGYDRYKDHNNIITNSPLEESSHRYFHTHKL